MISTKAQGPHLSAAAPGTQMTIKEGVRLDRKVFPLLICLFPLPVIKHNIYFRS